MLRFLLSIWQFPQHLVGMIILFFYLKQQRIADHFIKGYSDVYVIDKHPSGVSFGPIIFVRENYDKSVNHEYGHSKQSMYLGPLYLLVIGLPSLLHYWWWNPTCKKDYYEYWCEKWADKLGGVKRY